jgi:hypothetical protein
MEFEREELVAIFTLGLTAGVVVAYDRFVYIKEGTVGTITIDFSVGLVALLLTCIGMIISVFIHEWGHKYFAHRIGYATHTEAYAPGQIVGVVIAIFSFGWLQFFTPNTADLEAIPERRMHRHRVYENPRQQAFIAASGLIVTAVWASLLHGAWLLTDSPLVRDIMLGNIWIMIYSLIPLELFSLYALRHQRSIEQVPQGDGLYLLHYSLPAYTFAAAFVIIVGFTLYFNLGIPIWVSLLVALMAGLAVWIRFFMEQN